MYGCCEVSGYGVVGVDICCELEGDFCCVGICFQDGSCSAEADRERCCYPCNVYVSIVVLDPCIDGGGSRDVDSAYLSCCSVKAVCASCESDIVDACYRIGYYIVETIRTCVDVYFGEDGGLVV